MIGLNATVMVGCPSCKQARSLNELEIERFNKEPLIKVLEGSENIACSCGHGFSYLEGIVQGIILENIFSAWDFVSDIRYAGVAQICVGHESLIKLPKIVPAVNKVYLTCIGRHADVLPLHYGDKNVGSFYIISSESIDGVKVGEPLEVSWLLYGRSDSHPLPTWRKLLVQAKEELLQQQFNLALLTSEMAFESFIDTVLNNLFARAGLPQEASYIIIESINSIYTKVHKLLYSLEGIKFKECSVNKKWQTLVEKRNKIAHGEFADIPEAEAMDAFETVVRAIIYILARSKVAV